MMMNWNLFFVCFINLVSVSLQINCHSCTGSTYGTWGRNYECVRNVTALTPRQCTRGYYCSTIFTFRDGIISRVSRSCQNPQRDHDDTSDVDPGQNGCVSSYSTLRLGRGAYYSTSAASLSTTCYRSCTTDECNEDTPDTLKECPSHCNGNCNFITGLCQKFLSCVQCSGATDPGCEKKTESTSCPKGTQSYNYCAVSKIITFDKDMKKIRNDVTKSCTKITKYNAQRKSCGFSKLTNSDSNAGNTIYTCDYFCATDGCNTGIDSPGFSVASDDSLYCVICEQKGDLGNCVAKTETNRCPSSSTHCKSTVRYYSSTDQYNAGTPAYQIHHIVRECATDAVTPQCSRTPIEQTGVDKVTCVETCKSHGCNVGWPARPKCSQCNGSLGLESFENCLTSPSEPSPCQSPTHAYCVLLEKNTEIQNGYARSIYRGCSNTDLGSSCTNVNVNGISLRNCHNTCTTDGCNQGMLVTESQNDDY